MKKLNLALIAILGLGLTFTSCKDDDSPEPTTQQKVDTKKEDPKPEPTNEELLVGKKWTVTAIVLDEPIDMGNGEYLSDLYEYMDDCEKDDYTIYKADGSGTDHLGDLKCDANEEVSNFLWYINPDNKNELWMDVDGETIVLTFFKITEKDMILETEGDMGGEKTLLKIHFKAV